MNEMFLTSLLSFLLLIGQSYSLSAQQIGASIQSAGIKVTTHYPRSCFEIKKSYSSTAQESGLYWIDPDGAGIGDGPILVECNMTTGVTSVLHNAETLMKIPICPETPKCYEKEITYSNATLRQLRALAEISEECHQSIEINCLRGPLFEYDNAGKPVKAYSSWVDRNGNEQSFWSGKDETALTCECGIQKDCIASNINCNCDANVAIPLTDQGEITKKEALPITRLQFSNTKYEGGSHKVGRFECSGLVRLPESRPTSCEDLWRLGETVNGYYVFSVPVEAEVYFYYYYCDFLEPEDGKFVMQEQLGLWKGTES